MQKPTTTFFFDVVPTLKQKNDLVSHVHLAYGVFPVFDAGGYCATVEGFSLGFDDVPDSLIDMVCKIGVDGVFHSKPTPLDYQAVRSAHHWNGICMCAPMQDMPQQQLPRTEQATPLRAYGAHV